MLSPKLSQSKCLRYLLILSTSLCLGGNALAQLSQTATSLSPEDEFALIQSCDNADATKDATLNKRCEARQATMATILKSTLNQWIELESHKPKERVYVAIPDQTDPFSLTSRRIHLRYDTDTTAIMAPATLRRYPPTVVRTLNLNCKNGETTLLALRVYDLDGKLEFGKDVEQPKAESILHFYQSPLRLVCSKEYLTSFVPNGAQLIAMQKAADARELKITVPDRSVAVPK